MAFLNKFSIYDTQDHCYLKTNCVLESIIEPHHPLSDDEVRQYFKIDEDHPEWERAHRPSKVKRYVFDKCIIPENKRFRVEGYYYDKEDD